MPGGCGGVAEGCGSGEGVGDFPGGGGAGEGEPGSTIPGCGCVAGGGLGEPDALGVVGVPALGAGCFIFGGGGAGDL